MRTSTDKLPPHSPEAERGVLGCMLQNPARCIDEAVRLLPSGADTFYDLRHRELYVTLLGLSNESTAVDTVTLTSALRSAGKLEAVGGIEYIVRIENEVPSPENLPFYTAELVEKHMLRVALNTCTELVTAIYENHDDPMALIEEAERRIIGIRNVRPSREMGMVELTRQTIDVMEARNSGENVGIPTGLSDIDRTLNGGLQPGEVYVIAGRPSTGKTSLATTMAMHIACGFLDRRQGEHVVILSLEMTAQQLHERILAAFSDVNTRCPIALMGERDQQRLHDSVSSVKDLPIIIDDTAEVTINGIKAVLRRMVSAVNAKVAIIDYLQLVSSEPRSREECRRAQVDGISRGLKIVAKELGIPIVVLAQLNRDIEKDKSRMPRLSDLRESGAIEQDASFVGIIYSKGDSVGSPTGSHSKDVKLRICKNRFGGADFDIGLVFKMDTTRYFGAAKISPEDMP